MPTPPTLGALLVALLAAAAGVAARGDTLQPAAGPPAAANASDAAPANATAGEAAPANSMMWREMTGLLGPSKRFGHSATAVGGDLYVVGGCYLDRACFRDVWVLDAAAKTWYELKASGSLPPRRGFHTASLLDDELWVFGGSDANQDLRSDVYRLDTKTFRWSQTHCAGERPSARDGHSAVATPDGKVVVFGGYTGTGAGGGYSHDVFVLDPRRGKGPHPVWSRALTRGAAPTGRSGHGAVLHEGLMYVFGGFSYDTHDVNTLHVLRLERMEWSAPETSGPAPSPRHGALLATYQQLVFVVGGCSQRRAECYNDTSVLDLADRQWAAVEVRSPTQGAAPSLADQDPEARGVSNDLVKDLLKPVASNSSSSSGETGGAAAAAAPAAGGSSGSSGGSSGEPSESSESSASSSSEGGAALVEVSAAPDAKQGRFGGLARPLTEHSRATGARGVELSQREYAGGAFVGAAGELFLFGGCYEGQNCSFDTLALQVPPTYRVKMDEVLPMNPTPARVNPLDPNDPQDGTNDEAEDLAAAREAAAAAEAEAAAPEPAPAKQKGAAPAARFAEVRQGATRAERLARHLERRRERAAAREMLIEEEARTDKPLPPRQAAEQKRHEADKLAAAKKAAVVAEAAKKAEEAHARDGKAKDGVEDRVRGDYEVDRSNPKERAKADKAEAAQKKLMEAAQLGDANRGLKQEGKPLDGGSDSDEDGSGAASSSSSQAEPEAVARARRRALKTKAAAEKADADAKEAQAKADEVAREAGGSSSSSGSDSSTSSSSSSSSSSSGSDSAGGSSSGGSSSSSSSSSSGSSSSGSSSSTAAATAAKETGVAAAAKNLVAMVLPADESSVPASSTLKAESADLVADMFVPLVIVLVLVVSCGAYVFCSDPRKQ